MSDFNWTPDYGLQSTWEPDRLEAKFGEGYSQRVPLGFNPDIEKFEMRFTRAPAVVDAIHEFLKVRQGCTAFTWTLPGGAEIRVICTKLSRTYQDYGNHVLNCTFERVYE